MASSPCPCPVCVEYWGSQGDPRFDPYALPLWPPMERRLTAPDWWFFERHQASDAYYQWFVRRTEEKRRNAERLVVWEVKWAFPEYRTKLFSSPLGSW